MRLFISEYVCGGNWPLSFWPESLAREGSAMLEAVVSDFLTLPDVEVWTSWDARLGPAPLSDSEHSHSNLFLEIIHSRDTWADAWKVMQRHMDAALVIAPETGGVLLDQCQELSGIPGLQSWNCSPDAVRLCGDKQALHRHLVHSGIPMPRQWSWQDRQAALHGVPAHRFVVKLRDGAGSQDMRLLTARDLQREAIASQGDSNDGLILEEYVPGRAISVAAIFDSQGSLRTLFPPAEQHLSQDGQFTYQGGTVPAPSVPLEAIHRLVTDVGERIPGLRGYLGFDLVLPDQSQEVPCLIEINPRLTTSYVGYRQATSDNLARWLNPWNIPSRSPEWTKTVSFLADGSITAMQEIPSSF